MSRYIDADVFKENVVKYSHQSLKTIGLALDETPTVDAVPVVRCEDCKHLGCNDGYYFCNAIGIAFGDKPNWFCADGERRSDD